MLFLCQLFSFRLIKMHNKQLLSFTIAACKQRAVLLNGESVRTVYRVIIPPVDGLFVLQSDQRKIRVRTQPYLFIAHHIQRVTVSNYPFVLCVKAKLLSTFSIKVGEAGSAQCRATKDALIEAADPDLAVWGRLNILNTIT